MEELLKSLLLIAIFKNVVKNHVVKLFVESLYALEGGFLSNFIEKYSDFISVLYKEEDNQNFYEHIKTLIYTDENILSKGKTSDRILKTGRYELELFDKLLDFSYEKILLIAKKQFKDNIHIIEHLPEFTLENKKRFDLQDIIKSYQENGYGILSEHSAFAFRDEKIQPIKDFAALTFSKLKNYEYQKEVIYNNTKAFIEGKETNNILLYGDRGCGKSSTVKALINEFKDRNLKIVQISKDSFVDLAKLYEILRKQPLKFIIFADDISFEENDKDFSSIKAALEGSLTSRPRNTVIYATTNRIHLVKENFSSRTGDELHLNDTIDESVSLSDRFGIVLTFSLLNKTEYLDIVKKIAQDYNMPIDDKLMQESEKFAVLKGIRTPRVARQFLTYYNSI